jgi:DNA-binding protein HU-beta
MNVTKEELAADMAAQTGMTKLAAGQAIDALMKIIKDRATMNQKIVLRGFGTFEGRFTAARQGRNPATGEPVAIAACTTLKFKASGKL